jgi:hypothetical protein
MMFKKWPGKNGTKKVWVPIFIKSCWNEF